MIPQPWQHRLERGQSLVEMAFGTMILIFILGGMVDIGRAFISLVALENGAGEGALYGATHPECLTLYNTDATDDTATGTCAGNESVAGRVYAEGNAIVNLNDANTTIVVDVENGAAITAGSVLRIQVTYRYTPWTPIGFLLWGSQAQVEATARQQVMSPPPPGYQY